MAFTAEHEDISRENLELLKAKFDVLQGERRAYFDTYEQTKRTNDQLLRELRDRQKELQKQLVDTQKRSRSGKDNKVPAFDEGKIGDELIRKRAEYDKLRNRAQALQTEMHKLDNDLVAIRNISSGSRSANGGASRSADEAARGKDAASTRLADLLAEEEDPRAASASQSAGAAATAAAAAALKDTPLMKRARAAESRLDKTALKYEEVMSIRKTYEGIVKRLKDERTGYDAQVGSLEKELAGKTKDFYELQNLAADAVRALDSSQVDLGRVRAQAAADRERLARELREREMMAKARQRHSDATLARERARADLLAEVAGDLGVSEERALIASVEAARAQRNSLNEQAGVVKRKLEAYESAWRRIREATGVSDISEVTSKMAAQVEQHASLAGLSRDNAVRLEGLREEITAFSRLVQELRFTSGEGEGAGPSSGTAEAAAALADDEEEAHAAKAHAADSAGGYARDEKDKAADDGPRVSEAQLLASASSRVEALHVRQASASAHLVELRMGVSHLYEAVGQARHAMGAEPLALSARAVPLDSMHVILRESGATLRHILRLLARHALGTGVDLMQAYGGMCMDVGELAELAAEDELTGQAGAGGAMGRALTDALSMQLTDGPGATRPSLGNSPVKGSSAFRPETPGGTGVSATFARMMPSPQALALLGLRDDDLMAARSFNNRVVPSVLKGVSVVALGESADGRSYPAAPVTNGTPAGSPVTAPSHGSAQSGRDGEATQALQAGSAPALNRFAAFMDGARPASGKTGVAGMDIAGLAAAAAGATDFMHGDVDINAADAATGDAAVAGDAAGDDGRDGTLTREAIKRQARRTTDVHKPAGGAGRAGPAANLKKGKR